MKKPTIKALIKKADDAFQTMIRYRDNFKCITCGRQFPFGERTNLHAGHFVGRGNKSVRWDEENVNAQCAYCNMQQSFGNVFVIRSYENALESKYGIGTVERLIKKGKQPFKPTREFLEDIIKSSNEFVANKKAQRDSGVNNTYGDGVLYSPDVTVPTTSGEEK